MCTIFHKEKPAIQVKPQLQNVTSKICGGPMSTSYQMPPVSVGIITHIPPQSIIQRDGRAARNKNAIKCLAILPSPAGRRKYLHIKM